MSSELDVLLEVGLGWRCHWGVTWKSIPQSAVPPFSLFPGCHGLSTSSSSIPLSHPATALEPGDYGLKCERNKPLLVVVGVGLCLSDRKVFQTPVRLPVPLILQASYCFLDPPVCNLFITKQSTCFPKHTQGFVSEAQFVWPPASSTTAKVQNASSTPLFAVNH